MTIAKYLLLFINYGYALISVTISLIRSYYWIITGLLIFQWDP